MEGLQEAVLRPERADSFLLQAWRKGHIGTRMLPAAFVDEWEKPSHEEFDDRTAWSLLNAYTEVMKDRQSARPYDAAVETIGFQRYLQEATNGVQTTAV